MAAVLFYDSRTVLPMNVLLLSMPDAFEHMPAVAIRMPNGALASLAGNVDAHHRVAVADLILAHGRVRATVERLVRDLRPDVVGLSVMTFQRATALKIARLVRQMRPEIHVVVGGYDPSLAPRAYESCADVHFVVRGEGEQTLCELLRVLDAGGGFDGIAGLAHRSGGCHAGLRLDLFLVADTEQNGLPFEGRH